MAPTGQAYVLDVDESDRRITSTASSRFPGLPAGQALRPSCPFEFQVSSRLEPSSPHILLQWICSCPVELPTVSHPSCTHLARVPTGPFRCKSRSVASVRWDTSSKRQGSPPPPPKTKSHHFPSRRSMRPPCARLHAWMPPWHLQASPVPSETRAKPLVATRRCTFVDRCGFVWFNRARIPF